VHLSPPDVQGNIFELGRAMSNMLVDEVKFWNRIISNNEGLLILIKRLIKCLNNFLVLINLVKYCFIYDRSKY
jgi:hypothetical protein